jgi:hypothetical protein
VEQLMLGHTYDEYIILLAKLGMISRSMVCQWFGVKMIQTVCQWFDLKTIGTVSPGLASKPVAMISPDLSSKPVA